MNLYAKDIKERLFVEVYNAAKMENILKEVAHECREDLVLVYRLSGYDKRSRRDCELVTNEQLEPWGVDVETLKQDAWANTMAKRPPMMLELGTGGTVDLSKNYLKTEEPIPRGAAPELDMFILTNGVNSNGAICMFDEKTMQKVAEKLGDNLIVLPASVHETIVFGEATGLNIRYAKDLVNSVNRTALKDGEFLSGEIYRYDKDSHTLSIVQVPEHEEIPMPDNISMEEMYAYGYTWDGMLPVSRDRALKLWDADLPTYRLYDDGTEGMVETKEEIFSHDGLFGVERETWIGYLRKWSQREENNMTEAMGKGKIEETRMQFDEFMKYAVENIKAYLPQECQDAKVFLGKGLKNNTVPLNALCIVGKERVVPSIYLEQFYVPHLYGMPMEEVMQHMANIYVEGLRPDLQYLVNTFEYENVKDKIGVSVCNAAKNRSMLQDIPHEMKGEFALTYHVKVKLEEGWNGKILINNDRLAEWGIDEKTLRETAWYNMEHRFPYQLSNLHDMIEAECDVSKLPDYDRNSKVYILTNPERFHGAVYMFDRKVMSEVAKKFATDMLLLPISVHECVLFRRDEVQDLEGLKAEIAHVQRTQIRPEDILSGNIFLLDAQTQTLSELDEMQSQEQGMTQQM